MRCAILFLAAGLAHAQTYNDISGDLEMDSSYSTYGRALNEGSGDGGGSGSYGGTTTTTTTVAPTTVAPTTAAPAPAPKVSFKTGLGGIDKTTFTKPKVQLAYKTKIAAEINKQSSKHDHAHRRRLANGNIKPEDITIKNIASSTKGITFDVEITVKTTSGAGTDLKALATEVQNRANNLIEKIQTNKTFADTFKNELKTELVSAGATITTANWNAYDIGKNTKAAKIAHTHGSGSGAAIGGAVAAVLVVGGLAFMMWKKKQAAGGAGKVAPTVTPAE